MYKRQGIGNGVLQDILFQSGLHPKRKLSTLNEQDQIKLCRDITAVLTEMTECGGRDTEKDLYGKAGGYRTKMSKQMCIRDRFRKGGGYEI